MKNLFRLIVILVMACSFIGCQTAAKTKPLTEMTPDERRAVYMNGPISTPEKEHRVARTAIAIVGIVLIALPIGYLTSLAASGGQIHAGK